MDTNSIILEQKRAELQVKLTILQENINNIKQELSDNYNNNSINAIYPGNNNLQIANLEQLALEYNSANELHKLKEYERKSLNDELLSQKNCLEKLKLECTNLIKEKSNLEYENLFHGSKIKEMINKINDQKKKLFEMRNKRELLEQEVEILDNNNIKGKKIKFDNEQKEVNINLQRKFIEEQVSNNNKRIDLLQIKIDKLNKDIENLKNNINQLMKETNDFNEYNQQIENKIIEMNENNNGYSNKIIMLQKEIDETKDYINSSQKEKKNMNKKLEQLTDILSKINQTNIKINANLNFVRKSLEKKALFMGKEEDYYANCEKVKQKMVDVCKEIDSYSNLI